MTAPALPEPAALDLATIADLGAQIIAWAAITDDVAAVKDAAARWAAITEYVRRTSREGVAEAEATLRRLDIRVGLLLGPAEPANQYMLSGAPDGIPREARRELRLLAEHADVVEEVIAASDDASPPSRRKCLAEIARRRDAADEADAVAVTAAAAPRILAALAALPDPDYPGWIVTLRFQPMHRELALSALPPEADLVSIEEDR